MKIKILIISIVFAAGSLMAVSCGEQTETTNSAEKQDDATKADQKNVETVEFFVRGNCGMCRERIENALSKVEGIQKGTWDVETSKATVSYDKSVATQEDFHVAVANVGHRTETKDAEEGAYADLPPCCKDPEDDDYIPMN